MLTTIVLVAVLILVVLGIIKISISMHQVKRDEHERLKERIGMIEEHLTKPVSTPTPANDPLAEKAKYEEAFFRPKKKEVN